GKNGSRKFIATVFAPHNREHSKLRITGLAAVKFEDQRVLLRGQSHRRVHFPRNGGHWPKYIYSSLSNRVLCRPVLLRHRMRFRLYVGAQLGRQAQHAAATRNAGLSRKFPPTVAPGSQTHRRVRTARLGRANPWPLSPFGKIWIP